MQITLTKTPYRHKRVDLLLLLKFKPPLILIVAMDFLTRRILGSLIIVMFSIIGLVTSLGTVALLDHLSIIKNLGQ